MLQLVERHPKRALVAYSHTLALVATRAGDEAC